MKVYTKAQLYISQINLLETFRNLVKFQHPNLKFSGWTKGQKLYEYLSANPSRLIEGLQEGDSIPFAADIKLNVLYPSKECIKHFDNEYKTKLNKLTQKVSDIELRKDPNSSRVITIDFSKNFNSHSVVIEAISDEYASIYLADLEFEKERGLDYVLDKGKDDGKEFNVFKVPHHGSKTSFDKTKWEQVLAKPYDEQFLKLTCWKKGLKFLPEEKVVSEMSKITNNIFCTGIPQNSTVKIENATKKYYNNASLSFSVAAHNYGRISIDYSISDKKLNLDIHKPAVHFSEL